MHWSVLVSGAAAGLILLASLATSGAGVYLLTLAVAAFFYKNQEPQGPPSTRLAVLVPAHDEAALVARCVHSLLAQDYPAELFRVIVIADNCSDDTASLAASAGAEVMLRRAPEARGKGQALRWAIDRLAETSIAPDAVVVVDADSVAAPDLLSRMQAVFKSGQLVVQAEYLVLGDGSRRSRLAEAAFLLFHRARFAGRAVLGMPAFLVGNGMMFSWRLLERYPWQAFSAVEDLEYSISLRLAGFRPAFAGGAHVYGPIASGRAHRSQRLRWEGGRFHVVRTLLPQLTAAALRSPGGVADAAVDLAVPPLGILCLACGAGLAFSGGLALAAWAPRWEVLPWAIDLVLVTLYVVLGLLAAGASSATFAALLQAPFFLARKTILYASLGRGFDPGRWVRTEREPVVAPPHPSRGEIDGVPIDLIRIPDAIERLVARASGGGPPDQVCTVNLDFLVSARHDDRIKRLFRSTALNLADGAPVVWLGRILGLGVPERVAGLDLVAGLLAAAAAEGLSVFLLGGEAGAAAEAASRIQARDPRLRVAGFLEPPRATLAEMASAEIVDRINQSGADIVLVALGHPKQDLWIDLYRDQLQAGVAIGVGCAFDLWAGRKRRAPRWMQAVGLEWLYRLAMEPRRLFRRYLVDATWLLVMLPGALAARVRGAGKRPLAPPAAG